MLRYCCALGDILARKQHTTEEKLIRELKSACNLSANEKKKDFKIEKKYLIKTFIKTIK